MPTQDAIVEHRGAPGALWFSTLAFTASFAVWTIFSIIGSFQLFNEPNILKPLAPNTITTFFTPNMYAYNLSFAGQQYNYAATVAIIMGVITAVIAYVVQLRGSRQEAR